MHTVPFPGNTSLATHPQGARAWSLSNSTSRQRCPLGQFRHPGNNTGKFGPATDLVRLRRCSVPTISPMLTRTSVLPAKASSQARSDDSFSSEVRRIAPIGRVAQGPDSGAAQRGSGCALGTCHRQVLSPWLCGDGAVRRLRRKADSEKKIFPPLADIVLDSTGSRAEMLACRVPAGAVPLIILDSRSLRRKLKRVQLPACQLDIQLHRCSGQG